MRDAGVGIVGLGFLGLGSNAKALEAADGYVDTADGYVFDNLGSQGKPYLIPTRISRILHGDLRQEAFTGEVKSLSDYKAKMAAMQASVADPQTFSSFKARYFRLPGSAVDISGELLLENLHINKEETTGLLSEKSYVKLPDGSYVHPDKKVLGDKFDEWDALKNILLGNFPLIEGIYGDNNEKFNLGELVGECDANVYIFERMPIGLRKELQAELFERAARRANQTVISNYWMLEAIKADINSEDPQFFELYDRIFKSGTDKKNGKKYLQNALKGRQQGAALFLRVRTHYDDTTSICSTIDFIPSLRYGDVYLYYTPVPQPKDPALKLQAKHEDISEFVRFFQRYLEDEVPALDVLSTPYTPGKNILGLPLE